MARVKRRTIIKGGKEKLLTTYIYIYDIVSSRILLYYHRNDVVLVIFLNFTFKKSLAVSKFSQ
jgi:hypothetical protein